MLNNLTHRTGRALSFRLVGSALDVGLSVVLGIVLARILPPEEFGLFGVAVSIVAMAEMLGSCGMLRALVQRKHLLPEHESAAVIFQFGAALLLSALLFAFAPVLSAWFIMPGLAIILRLQPVILLIHAVALLPEARLTRRLAFDHLTIIQASTRALGGGVAIFAAMQGMGAIALVIGSIITSAVRTVLFWICAPGSVPLRLEWCYFGPLFRFGSAVSITNITNLLAQRLDVLIIARLVGSAGVGLYQRALQMALLPLAQMTGPVNKVLFPAMSSVQDQPGRFRRGYLATVRFSALVVFPVLTFLWATADIVVPFVYGPMWEDAVPILQIVCIAGIFRVLTNSQALVAQAQGRARAEAVRQFVWLLLVALCGIIGSRAGVVGVALGITLASFLFFVSMTHLALPLAGVSLSDWWNAMRAGIVGCTVMALSIVVSKILLIGSISTIILLVAISCVGLCAYVAVIRFCLSSEDAKFADLVSGILPPRLGNLLRSILGINSANVVHGIQGNISAKAAESSRSN